MRSAVPVKIACEGVRWPVASHYPQRRVAPSCRELAQVLLAGNRKGCGHINENDTKRRYDNRWNAVIF